MAAEAEEARRALEHLLGRDVEEETRREATLFDELAAPLGGALVLHGAGRLGQRTLDGLRRHGIEPLAFSDFDPALWGSSRGGLRILPPEEAAARHGRSAVFVVSIWNSGHRYVETEARLRGLGCRRVLSCVPLFYKLAETFLPYYSIDLPHRILEDAARVERAFALLSGEESRQEFLGVLRWSLDLDFAGAPPRPIGEQYFPPDLRSVSPEEVFFDCGAFDGDTVQAFVSRSGGAFRQIVAFEPVLENFERLARRVASMDASVRERVILRRLAVGEEAGRLSFSSAGASSTAAEPASGAADVECAALDALGDLPRPTYVKLDVEGMELEALRGARKVIRGAGPALAVCAYHRLEHLWEVPLAIRELRVDYAVHLRRYAERPWELVVYAVPLLRREGACP